MHLSHKSRNPRETSCLRHPSPPSTESREVGRGPSITTRSHLHFSARGQDGWHLVKREPYPVPYFFSSKTHHEYTEPNPTQLYVLEQKVTNPTEHLIKAMKSIFPGNTQALSLTPSLTRDDRGRLTSPETTQVPPGICRFWVQSHGGTESIL